MRMPAMLKLGAFALLATLALSGAALAQGDLEPIPLELPDPSYMGTPLSYWSDRLEIETGPREPFLAPKGTVNVAKEKPVTSSAKPTVGELAMLTDGDKSADESAVVELPKGPQYVQVDLGAPQAIHAVVFWHFHAAERVYFDVIVKVADDPDFTENVVTLFNNDHDNSSSLGVGEQMEYIDKNAGKLVDGKGTKARYVRLYSNGNTTDDMNHYLEVEVYATPAE
jgi:hypothetical protein